MHQKIWTLKKSIFNFVDPIPYCFIFKYSRPPKKQTKIIRDPNTTSTSASFTHQGKFRTIPDVTNEDTMKKILYENKDNHKRKTTSTNYTYSEIKIRHERNFLAAKQRYQKFSE